MARYSEDAPLTCEYDDDCAVCGAEWPRSELAWLPDNSGLECPTCTDARENGEPVPAEATPDGGWHRVTGAHD